MENWINMNRAHEEKKKKFKKYTFEKMHNNL